MGDMLVKLYDLPDHAALVAKLEAEGVAIRRALPPEKQIIADWVRANFFPHWACECERAIFNAPVSCFVAIEGQAIIGFACYDATCKGFFGPFGVAPAARKRRIGTALLWTSLRAMAAQGHAYAIIGWVSSEEYYVKACGAIPIPGSEPGIFRGMLKT